jgi:bacterioferritin
VKGNERIIEALNARLIDEATGIAQYSAHLAAVGNWGYQKLVDYIKERRDDEIKHFNWICDHIYFLGGIPAVGRIGTVNVGGTVTQMHTNDQIVETNAISAYTGSIELCIELGDHITRALLEKILADERDHENDLESQLDQISQMGLQIYLGQQL